MIALLVAVAVAQTSAEAPSDAPMTAKMYGGVQTGFPMVLGATGRLVFLKDAKPRFDADLTWEPSAFLQSYSIAASWRPLGGTWYAGARVRWLQFGAPWARGASSTNNHLGLGIETGWRWCFLNEDKLALTVGFHAAWVPTQATNLQSLFGVNVGVAWRFWDLQLPSKE